jgi:hypothetical protein
MGNCNAVLCRLARFEMEPHMAIINGYHYTVTEIFKVPFVFKIALIGISNTRLKQQLLVATSISY